MLGLSPGAPILAIICKGTVTSDPASAKDGFDLEFDRLILPGAMVPLSRPE
jgi:hypothetical protein